VEQFWGVSGTAWTGIYTIITFGLLVVAVVAVLYAKKQWQIGREQAEDARTAQVEASRTSSLPSSHQARAGTYSTSL